MHRWKGEGMKKWSKVIGVLAVAAVAALCLAACGGGGGSAASSSSAAKAYDPIYVVTNWKMYSNMGDGNPVLTGEWVMEYDEHGNNTKQTITNINPTTNEKQESVSTWSDFDANGYPAKFVNAQGATSTTKWTVENGQAVSAGSDMSTSEFAYYDDGKLKSQVIEYPDRKVTVEYDENGRQTSQVTEGGEHPSTTEMTWTLDDKGFVTGLSRTSTMANGEANTDNFTVECDENGNIVKVIRDGVLAYEFEYQKIDNPSTWAWVKSFNPRF